MSGGLGMVAGQMVGQALDIIGQPIKDNMQNKMYDRQMERDKEMSDYLYDLSMKKFKDQGYGAQAQQLRNAGMNVGLMYGGAGGGAQTTAQQGSTSGGGNQQANNAGTMAMLGQQAELMKAQKENIEADTEVKKAEAGVKGETTRGQKFDNDINELYRDKIEQAKNVEWDMTLIKGEEANAAWEFKKAIEYEDTSDNKGGPYTNENSRKGRARIAEMKMYEEDLRKAKLEGNIKEAEEVIKDFEASMARQGISPNSPWYAKLITDLLNKIGITDLLGIGQKQVRKEVIGK